VELTLLKTDQARRSDRHRFAGRSL
jgi:hypothetical protein